jgi:hypothetical protein
MSNVISFDGRKKSIKRQNAKAKTLCGNGFHKWQLDKKQQFDVKSGRLVTVYKCKHCGAIKNKAI